MSSTYFCDRNGLQFNWAYSSSLSHTYNSDNSNCINDYDDTIIEQSYYSNNEYYLESIKESTNLSSSSSLSQTIKKTVDSKFNDEENKNESNITNKIDKKTKSNNNKNATNTINTNTLIIFDFDDTLCPKYINRKLFKILKTKI